MKLTINLEVPDTWAKKIDAQSTIPFSVSGKLFVTQMENIPQEPYQAGISNFSANAFFEGIAKLDEALVIDDTIKELLELVLCLPAPRLTEVLKECQRHTVPLKESVSQLGESLRNAAAKREVKDANTKK